MCHRRHYTFSGLSVLYPEINALKGILVASFRRNVHLDLDEPFSRQMSNKGHGYCDLINTQPSKSWCTAFILDKSLDGCCVCSFCTLSLSLFHRLPHSISVPNHLLPFNTLFYVAHFFFFLSFSTLQKEYRTFLLSEKKIIKMKKKEEKHMIEPGKVGASAQCRDKVQPNVFPNTAMQAS